MAKNRYQRRLKQKKKEKMFKLVKKYLKVIASMFTALAAIFTFCFNYYEKAHDTNFSEIYFSMQITETSEEKLLNNNYASHYQEMLKYPTLNNEINELLKTNNYKESYIIYFILKEVGTYEARDVVINLLNTKTKEKKIVNVDFPISKNEGIKIPIAICEMDFEQPSDYLNKGFNFETCIKPVYKPVSITYSNKYLFSKQTKKIRELNMYKFIIEGEAVAAVGGPADESSTAWYLK